jgi:hypothetical protein
MAAISNSDFLGQVMLTNLVTDEMEVPNQTKLRKRDRDAWRDEDDDKNYELVPKPIVIEWN